MREGGVDNLFSLPLITTPSLRNSMSHQNRRGFMSGKQVLDVCLRSGGGGLVGGGLGTSFVSAHEI